MIKKMTYAEWKAEGERRFGPDMMKWKFICPVCKHVASVQDWKDAGASEGEIGFSCVGRHIPGSKDAFRDEGTGPCTYAGGGLFKLNPVTVLVQRRLGDVNSAWVEHDVFDFAPEKPAPEKADGDR